MSERGVGCEMSGVCGGVLDVWGVGYRWGGMGNGLHSRCLLTTNDFKTCYDNVLLLPPQAWSSAAPA